MGMGLAVFPIHYFIHIFLTGLNKDCLLTDTLYLLLFSIIVFLVLYLFFKLGMLGAGDVKLYTLASLYLSHNRFVLFFLFSMMIAAVIGVVKLIRLGDFRERIAYLYSYFAEILISGKVTLFLPDKKVRYSGMVHMAGPMLAAIVLSIFVTM